MYLILKNNVNLEKLGEDMYLILKYNINFQKLSYRSLIMSYTFGWGGIKTIQTGSGNIFTKKNLPWDYDFYFSFNDFFFINSKFCVN